MYEDAVTFLRNNRSLLTQNNFVQLRERCSDRLWPEVYDVLINNDVNPLTYEEMTKIPSYFFWGVRGVRKLIVPKNISKIDASGIANCDDLVSIYIENPNIRLEEGAINYLDNLQALNFANGMTSIPKFKLNEVPNLKIIRIPESVTRIAAGAFTAIPDDCVIVTPYRKSISKKLNISEAELDFYKKHLRFTHAPEDVEVEDEI